MNAERPPCIPPSLGVSVEMDANLHAANGVNQKSTPLRQLTSTTPINLLFRTLVTSNDHIQSPSTYVEVMK